jgi:hypothetical protein
VTPGPLSTALGLDAVAIAPVFADWWRDRIAGTNPEGRALRRWARTEITDRQELLSGLRAPIVLELCRRLGPEFTAALAAHPDQSGPGLVCAAVVLAHVSEDQPGAVGAAFRRRTGGTSDPILAESRFLNLTRQTAVPGLLRHGLRAVRLLGGRAPVGELGEGLLLWFHGRDSRSLWVADYYGLAMAARSGRLTETG